MTLKEGWFERQASKAKEEIGGWSTTKREVMLKETSVTRSDSKTTCTYEAKCEDGRS